MLESLILRDFQRHEKLRIDFDSRVTTIVGPSDVGKSAVIRALHWLCLNKPAGLSYKRHGAKMMSAALKVDGHIIKKSRSKSKNQYRLDGKTFKAFGTSVPEPIAKLLQMGPETFQRQMDSPFWFSETPGAVSRQLNQIVNLGSIDGSLSRAGNMVRETRTREEQARSRLKTHQNRLESLGWVERYVKRLEALEALRDDLERLEARKRKLQTLASRLKELDVASRITIPNLGKVEQARKRLKITQQKVVELTETIGRILKTQSKVRSCENQLREARKTEKRLRPKTCPKCGQSLTRSSISRP